MTHAIFPDDVAAAIARALLAFYDDSARDLPWRRTRDPYAIWISEVMAQQTRVETVIPYYERWIERYPDVGALAAAPVDDVLKAWEGLGYYSRARNLHRAAGVVRERHNGVLPSGYDALRALPGVGDYTAGAVASIAFAAREPAVDGNVRRVLSRILDEPAPTAARLRTAAAALVPADRPGDFNQALMELGARTCTPRAPRCTRCVVASHCRAFARGTQLDRPAARARRQIPTIDVATAVLRRADGDVLLVRRPAHGLLAGMWTFPGTEITHDADATRACGQLAQQLGLDVNGAAPLGDIEHVFSHRRERYRCVMLDVTTSPDTVGVWVGEDRSGLALPRAQQRIHSLAFSRHG